MKKIVILIICFLLCACTMAVSREVIIDDVFPVSSKITLKMVGDALIHSTLIKDAKTGNSYDFKPMFKELKDIIKNSDLLYYNAETIIGGKYYGYSGYPSFNTPDEFAKNMISLGFNVVSRANNHTLDKGTGGLLYACNFWNEYPNVLTNGSACTKYERDNIRILEKNNIRYALLSYTTLTNGLIPDEDYYLNIYSDDIVKNDIAHILGKTDVIIVAMHWGDEYSHIPNYEQRRIANYLSSLGVNIIIGTHPHVIEPIEWINDTLVIYSLGNFISGQSLVNDYNRRIGLMTSIDIIKITTSDQVKIKLTNLNTELLYTYSNRYKDYKVIPFSKIDDNILKNYETLKEKYNDIVKYYDSSIITN